MSLARNLIVQALTGRLGREFEQFDQLPSTMDVARERAATGAPEGLVVLAEEQTAGRGRMGRAWVSPPGQNLYFTLLLRPDLPGLRRLPYLVPLGLCWGLESLGFAPRVKWPNDIWFNGKKASGVLIDTVVEGDIVTAVLVGIGMNVNLRPSDHPEIAAIATSLAEVAGHGLERERVLAALLDGVATALDGAPSVTFAAWRSRLATLHQRVTLRAATEVIEGLAVDVDPSGALVIEAADGSRRTYSAGEVTSQV